MQTLKHFVDSVLAPELIGQDLALHKEWWKDVYLARHHTGLNGPAIQGISAPEVAAWDLVAKSAGLPLGKLLGGNGRKHISCYDTNCGWLGFSKTELVDRVKQSVGNGFRAIKIKIGSANFSDDLQRLEAVRNAVSKDVQIAVDVNCRWDLQSALKFAPVLPDFDIAWLEEPLHPFDVRGHAILADAIATPLLHGESICDPLLFRDMIESNAMDIVQPSEMKLGGISNWLEVAALARLAGKRVVPAGWTMMQIDQHLAAATPHCWMVEWIPWIRDIFQQPVRFEDGSILISDEPGASTTIKPEAFEKYAIK